MSVLSAKLYILQKCEMQKNQIHISAQGALMGLLHYWGEPTLGKKQESRRKARMNKHKL